MIMSFDGVVTNAVSNELSATLLGGRVDKIYQPEDDEIILNIRNKGKNFRLLISASSHNPRIYLTEHTTKNPAMPPMFCMLLRKHLGSGTILDIKQEAFDRILYIDISSIDELGSLTEKRLVVEIMGRHSNIILIDKDSKIIIDSIKRVNEEMSRVRQILPGLKYQAPPSQDKKNPLTSTKETFLNLIHKEKDKTAVFRFFYFNYMGISPLISKEICFNANIDMDRSVGSLNKEDIDALYYHFSELVEKIKEGDFTPVYIKDDQGKILAFYSFNLNQFGKANKHFSDSISNILDLVYRKKDINDRLIQRAGSLRRIVQTQLDRALTKYGRQKDELIFSKDRDKFKVYADLISAYLYKMPERAKEVKLENFYDENMATIVVPLDEKLTAVENAQKYYKKYSKLKAAEKQLKRLIYITRQEVDYLENVLFSIDNSTSLEDLNEIRDELVAEGYIRSSKKTKKKSKTKASKPYHYLSQDNFNIYVGRNNRQNEHLTFRFSHREDLWLHVQNMPGSHVIIKRNNQEIPDSTLEEAALLAAYFSKGRQDSKVAVDYTERKNVKKMPGGKLGMVIYENFKTIFVSPTKEAVKKIKKVET